MGVSKKTINGGKYIISGSRDGGNSKNLTLEFLYDN